MILNEYWTLPTGRYARLSGKQARPRLSLGVTRASLAALLLCLLAPLLAPPEALAQSEAPDLTISADETVFPESTAQDPRRPQVVLSASDVGGTATRLTLEPSLDSGQFTLGASSPSSGDRITATLSFIDPPDYENPTDAATPVGDAARDNIYLVDVTLNVRSGGSDERPTDTTRIRIRITPVDEYDPVLTNDRTHHRVNENIRGYFVQFHSTDADADGGPIRHEIVDDPVASPDRAHFRLVAFGTPGEVLYFRLPPDYEAPNDEGRDNIYNITVRATSGSPPRTSEPLALTIEISDNRREKSVIVNTRGTVVQNRTYEFRTGYAGVIDTFTIEGGDAGAFSFNPLEVQLGRTADLTSFRFNPSSGELSFSGPAPNATNNLRLSATNTSGRTVFASFSVRANHRAFGIRTGQRFPLPENSDPPQVQFTVTDPDDVPPHVRLFDSWDADLFTLESTSSGGTVTATLRFKTQPDFENPIDTEVTPNRLNPTNDAARNNIYLVRIGITEEVDSNGFVGAGYDVRIVVTNVDDGPTLFATEPTYEVPENTTEPIVTLRGIDADADTLRYEIVDGAASPDRDHFFLHRSTGVLRFASAQNFEEPSDANEDGTYHITVQATSGNPSRSSNRQTLRIRLTDGDDRVSVLTTTQATYEAPENTTDLIATLQGESVDGGGLRFEIAEGDTLSPDRAHFDLDPLSGELRFKDPQDFEAPSDVDGNGTYHIAVQATSSNPPRTSSPLALAITLTDDDDNDPTITPTQATYNFLTETMGTIATFTIEDDDADEARAFSALEAVPASGTNLTAFDFDPGSGVLSFQDPAVNATSRLIIRGTSGDKTAMLAITIAVMSDSPPVFAATEFTLPEDRNPPQVMLSATDADGATVTLTLTNTQDSTLFTLEDGSSTGGTTTANLRFIDPPDFEAPADTATAGGDAAGNNIYLVRVRAKSMNLDGVVVRTNETIRITVTNIDDNPPTLTNTETDHPVAEGRTDTFLTLVGSDADEDDSVRFTKSGGADVAHFTLDGTSGALRFASAPDFENPRGTPLSSDNTNTYHLSVQAESGTGQTTKTSPALALTIRVTPVDEDTPRITASTGLTTYNFLTGTTGPIATFTIEDSDAGEAHAFSALEAGPASGTDLADFSFNTDTGVLSFQGSAANATSRLIIRGTSNTKPAMLAITIRVADELVLNAPVNQNYTMNTAITDLALPEATGGTAPLTYTLTSVPGLTFNADTRRLSGTPDTAGTTTLTYEVMDANNASTTATFMVIVSDSLALTASGNQNYTQGTAITALTLPAATGGTAPLTYTLTGPGGLPGGLEFDADTRTLSGTPTNTASTFDLTYEVTDDNGASTNATFRVVIALRLRLSAPVNQNYTQGTLITGLELPEARGGREPLTYTLTGPGGLLGGLEFDADTRTLSGTPSTADTTTLTYEVTDANGASENATFMVIVNVGLALSARGDQNYTLDTEIDDLTLPAATGGKAPLTYTLTSVPGLNFNANTRRLSGTPDTAGTTTLTYEVMDANGTSASVDFMVIVSDSLALTASGNQNYTLGTTIPDLQLPAATGGTAPLTYTLFRPGDGNLPGGLNFNANTRTLSGTPTTAGASALTYRVSDANGASTSVRFTVIVNASLTLTASGNQNYTQGAAITALTLPAATGGTAPLTYTLTRPGGLPGGLEFDADTRTLSGTLANTASTFDLTYEVTDDNGASTNATFRVVIASRLRLSAPVNQNYTQGTLITGLELPEARGGREPLTYTLTGPGDLLGGLEFDADTRTLSGTPNTAGTTTLTYEVTDTNNASTSVTFTVIVNASLTLDTPDDQNYTLDTAITGLELPVATGGTGMLTYTLTGPGDSALPGGLTFTPGTRTLSGTPNTAGTTTLTYEVTDANGASTSVNFTVIVSDGLALSARGNQNYTQGTAITALSLPMATGGTEPLTYTLTGLGDSALPGGLTFTAGTRTLSGTPSTAGTTTLTYEVTDNNGASTSVDFTVRVNASLTLDTPDDQNYTMDTAITDLTLDPATGGTTPVTYTLTGPSGAALATAIPGLNFDANNRTLSGTPNTTATTVLTYTATDDNGSTAMDTFTVIVAAGVAVTAPGDQTYTMDTAITALSLPMATGGTEPLTYALTGPGDSALPGGLSFNANTRTLSGAPSTPDTTTLTYEVTDDNGASTSVDFTVIVNASLVLDTPANQNYTMDTAITDLTLDPATGGTTPVTYTLTGPSGAALATAIPGLNFDANNRTLSGTPNTTATTVLTYTATDDNGSTAMDTFTVTVADEVEVTAPGDQTYTMDTAITALTLDPATGGTGAVTYTLTPLPNGLIFNETTRVLSGTPTTADTTELTYTATDDNGSTAMDTFTVIVAAGVAVTAPGDQTYTMDTAITALTLAPATGGTTPVTYTLTPLPNGLLFNATTRVLSGTPNTTATTELTYTVTDDNGSTAMDTFTVIVAARVAVTAPVDQTYTMDTAITDLGLPMATGGTGTVTYTLAPLPNGLLFNATTRVLSGTPTTTDTTELTYTATDDNGSTAMDTFTVTVADEVEVTAPVDQTYTMDTAITDLTLSEAAGGTTPVTYTLAPLPNGLTFTAATRVLSGTPSTADTTTLTYMVTDTNGASTSVDFTVIVNASLTLDTPDDQNYTLDTAITDLQLPAATGGTAPLTYTLTSVPGLTFNADTRMLSGTPNTAATTTLTYAVTDTNGASTSVDFTVIVSDGLALTASANQNYTLDTAITDLQLPAATGGTGTLTYTLTSVPGLNFNAGTRILSGTPSTAGTTTLTYAVSDANNASTNATFTVTVSDGLALTASGNQNYTLDTAITALTLPEATGGTVPLTYTLTGPGDGNLPGGLTFGTRTLSGTPSTATTTTLTYAVTDDNGASTTATFMVTVNASLTLTASGNQNYTQGRAITALTLLDTAITALTLPAATGGTVPLTYTLTSVPGLEFDADTRILSGTPSMAGTTTLTYRVSDDNGASTTATFMVTVNASLTLTASGDQNYTQGRAITDLQLPEATGGTAPLTYTLTGPGGGNLPAGLTFNTRTLSGTPDTPDTFDLTYEVTDTNGASTSVDFTVIVSDGLALNTPANQNYTRGRAITGLTLPEATGGTGTLTYTLTSVPGLEFDADTRILSGTPSMAGTTTLTYRVSDDNGASTTATFMVTVNASLTLTASGDQNYTQGRAITDLQLPEATGGTAPLTYTLTGPGGGNLPAGLTFNTRTLSGTPDTPDTFDLTYEVTDTNGASTSVDFTVIVSDGLALNTPANQNYTRGRAITGLTLPEATGGTGTLTYTLTSVPGLTFTPGTRILSGTPGTATTTVLTYEVTDTNGASTTATFMVTVNASLTLTASGNQNYTLDTAIDDLQLPVATGGTVPLTYTLTSVPGLDFDPGTRTLSGTPDTAATTNLTYTVTDTNGASTTATFTVIVNDGLTLTASGNQNYTLDTAITDLSLPMATGGTGTLQYTLTGPSGLPGGLIFNANTRTLSGTPDMAATTTLTYEVTDTNGASTSVDFTVIVSDGLALTASGDQNYTLDTEIPALQLPAATGGTGTLTYTLTSVPGLSFNANTRTLSGTPDMAATTTLTYEVTDTNGASTSVDFTVIVSDGLALTASGDQNYTLDTEIPALQLPAATGGTGTLTYTLTSVPGLDFNAGTRILSGTPSTPDTTTLTYRVTDTNGASTTATFTVIVSDGLALTASGNQNYTLDTAITALQLPVATGGTVPLTYTLTSVPGLDFDPGTRTLSGTPDTAATTNLTYTVTDDNGASTTATFTVIVSDSLALTAPANQNYTQNTLIPALTLPVATGGTVPLTYTLTNVPGLSFNANTRTLSGTPDTAATTNLTYTVTDDNGASTNTTFTVIVRDGLALNTPANQNYTLDTAITDLTLPAATGGTVPLTYTLTSVPGLDFDPGTRTLSGTPDTAGTTTLTYRVTDANNASTTATFTVIVSDGLALSARGNQNYTRGTTISDLPLPVATGGTGTLQYTLTGPGDSALPGGLTFAPGTRTLSGTPDTAGTTNLTYEVSDANNASTSTTFTVIVNDGLALTASGNQNYTLDTAIPALQLPAATGGTGTLTYTLTSVPGLTFAPGTRTLSGTPDTAGTTNLTYEVSDANNASTSTTFTVIVNDGLALTASGNQNYTLDTAIPALQLPAATGGTGTLTYTLTSVPGLTFTPGTRTLSGTPDTPDTFDLTYRVTDTNGASTSVDFTVIVSDGLALTASGDQNYTLDTAITGLTLPAATGGTGTLTYTLTSVPGLNFTPGTRTLSGTPDTAGTTTLTYRVTDDNGASQSATFTITVRRDILPTFATTEFDLPENSNPPQVMLSATDADDATVTLTLTNAQDGGLFTLEDSASAGGTTTANLRFKEQPDFEAPADTATPDADNTYLVEVQASSMDLNGTVVRTTENLTITVTNIDDNDPVLDTTISTYDVPENSTEPIVTLQGTDADGDTLNFEIVDTAASPDGAHFALDASTGVLTFASAQDFEAPNDVGTDGTYEITVQAASGSPSRTSNSLALAITLTAIDEDDPTITPTQATYSFLAGATGTIATFTIVDSDADETRAFSALEAAPGSGTNLADFNFDPSSGVLSFQGAPAATTSALIIRATSGEKAALLAITITVDNADAPPVFVETTFSQVENTTPTLTLAATEADGDDVSFTLQSDGDATYFTLTDGGAAANTATLIFRDAPNFESPQGATLLAGDDGIKNTYQMNVQAASTTSPNAERTTTQIITINVTDADDPPTFTTAASALTIMEGDTTMTAMIEAIDQDGDSVTLALTGGADQARLRLTGATLSFISTPDFETPTDADANNIYEAEITASSTSSTGFTTTDTATGSTATATTALSAVRTFNITVTDADDNAPELTSSTTFQIQSGETAVATLEATDADSGDTETIVFALSGGADQNQFALTRAGVLSFTSAADFTEPTDADADNIYEAEITLTSGSRPHTTQAALEIEVISIDRQSRRRIGNVILAHIARSLADNTQDTILARTSGRLTNNLELSNRQGDLDDLIKGIQGFSFMQRLDAKQAATDATAAAAADADADATRTTTQIKERGFALWAKGRIRTFSASPNERAINNFSGHTYNLNLGADYQTGALLFGGLITASQSNVKFTSGSAEGQGKIRTKLTTFAPFMHFRLQGGTELWGSASFGQGRMHYQSETTDDGFESTDLKYAQVAGGLYQPLKALKKTNLALRVDGYTARLKADAFEDVFLAMAGDVSRVRALFEVGYRSQGVGNGVLDAKLNGGARLETGDIGKGVGLEFGVEITYANPASGLSVSADVNTILLHTAQKYRHLDAGLRILLDPGTKKRGLQFRLEPRIGGTASAAPLWDGALVDGSASPVQPLGTSGLGQLQTALGLSYGFAARQSLLTPFTEMRLDDRGAPIDLMLGVRLSRANRPINITLYTQKAPGTTPGVHLKLNWR